MSTIRNQRNTSAVTQNQEGPPNPGVVQRGLESLTRFAGDTAGDVAMIFGLMAMAMFMLIGSAVDMGRWLNARDQTQAAVDAAVLAGGRALQTNGGNAAAAVAVAKKYYTENIKGRLTVFSDTIADGFTVTDGGTVVSSSGSAYIKTPFMGLAGVHNLPLLNLSGSESAKAVLAVGGNSELNLEISMMLDTSGSMGEYTSSGNPKYIDMRSAAKDLVSIVVWADQGTYTSKVGIVPFSGDVRLPASLMAAVTPPVDVTWPALRTIGSGHHATTYDRTTVCVAERAGAHKYDDAAPGVAFVMPEYTQGGGCAQSAVGDELLPMTNVKATINGKIDGLVPRGMTAGHVGTAWASYLLSPNWASVLPSGSQPASYTAPKTKKIAILMTDGDYNSTHDSQGLSGGNVNGASSSAQAIEICNQMKTHNIDVYTVGFQMSAASQTAIDTLTACASDPTKFYNAENGENLKQAFRDIALKISSLYLKQ